MAKHEPKSLFRRLTRLFRSGPIVKRKIRALDTTIAVADKTKSSGTLLFQKSLSPTYATITSNAYNLSERLMRYQDFQEMEYSLGGMTLIACLDSPEGFITVSELAKRCDDNPGYTFIVYSYDHEKKQIVPALGKQARQTCVDHAWKVTFDNGKTITASPEHRLMLRDGTYRKTKDLQPGDAMMPFYRKDLFENAKEGTKGYSWVYTMDNRFRGWTKEHQLIAEWVAGRKIADDECVHHVNFVKTDNRPDNLRIMTKGEHSSLHATIINGAKWAPENHVWIEKFKKDHSEWMRLHNPVERKDVTFGRILETCEKVGFNITRLTATLDADLSVIKRRLSAYGFNDFETFARAYQPGWRNGGWDNKGTKNPRYDHDLTFESVCSAYEPGMTAKSLALKLGTTDTKVVNRIKHAGHRSWGDFVTSYQNCKVVSIEYVGVMPLYDLTVDGHKNFATDSVISHNTPEIAAALDIYADETCAQDEKGRIIHVYSDNERIRELLEDLFYNVLNTEYQMRSWARNLPVHKDTVIPLLDGRNVTIEELAHEMTERHDWTPEVYSVQDGTHQLVRGCVRWCGLTRENSQLVKVLLDDGSFVKCTHDHEWVLRDGRRKRADELAEGESLMPFYRETSRLSKGDRINGYEKVYDPATGKYEYTHRVDSLDRIDVGPSGKNVVHHIDFNKHNNSLSNLTWMGWHEHHVLHATIGRHLLYTPEAMAKKNASLARFNTTEAHQENQRSKSRQMKEYWSDERNVLAARRRLTIRFDKRCLDHVMDVVGRVSGESYLGTQALCNALKGDQRFIELVKNVNPNLNRDLTKILNKGTIAQLVERAAGAPYHVEVSRRFPGALKDPGFSRARIAFEKRNRGVMTSDVVQHKNHKVARVEHLEETSDVYCMEVLGPNGEHDRHNFAVLGCDDNGVSTSGVMLGNCKYGDFFLYNDVSPEYGVVNAFPIPVNEVEREENYDRDDPFAVRYRWVTLGNRTLENWEVTHFRLLGNDMFLPYGSSIIEPARRIWRQLILIEDAMLVYRVVRAPERRVFYIDVANVPPNEVPQYIEQQRAQLHTAPVIDRQTGRVDVRYNPMCLSMRTVLKLQDGRTLQLDELIKEWNDGKRDQWVYSIDVEGKRLVPGKVSWAGVTRKDAELVRVKLDDGSSLDVTPDHRFMLRDGTYSKAEDLRTGQALMPLYSEISSKAAGDWIDGYERVYDPATETYVYTHRINAELSMLNERSSVGGRAVVHHVDFNKRNNNPTNLCWMNYGDHRHFHAQCCEKTLNTPEQLIVRGRRMSEWNKSDDKIAKVRRSNFEKNSVSAMAWYNGSELHKQHNVQRSVAMKSVWNDPERRLRTTQNMRHVMTDTMFARLVEIVKQNPKFGNGRVHKLLMSDPVFINELQGQSSKRDWRKYSTAALCGELSRRGFATFVEFRNSIAGYKNHCVVSVERLEHREDTGCITVEKYHNFAAGGCDDSGQKTNSYVYLHNSVEEDYYIAVRGGESGTKIDTLKGGENTASVEDVAYIQKKLFAALKIPRAYLGYDEMLSCLTGDTQVPLLDGRVITVAQLAEQESDDTWTYSCDPLTGKIVPGRIAKAWKTKDVTELHRVVLDDGTVIKCTENHPFLCRDGSYKRADELKPGQSLMPLYRKLSSKKERDFQDGYEKVLNPSSNEWEFTHRIVNEYGLVCSHPSMKDEGLYVIHHVNHDKRNNSPLNLVKMGKKAHALYHAQNGQNLLSEASRDKLREVMKTNEYCEVHLDGVQRAWNNDAGSRRANVAMINAATKRKNIELQVFESLAASSNDRVTFAATLSSHGISWGCFRNNLYRQNVVPTAWLQKHFGGSRVGAKPMSSVTIEQVREYCIVNNIMSVTDWRRASAPPACGSTMKRVLKEAGFSSFNEFKKTLKFNHKVVSIEIVKLSSSVPVYDLEIEKYHNFAVITPFDGSSSPSLEAQGAVFVHNSKATLAQEDIRFSRTINVIQKTMMAELNKLAIIHLYAHGYDNEDLQNFILRLSNPSTVAQQQKLELWRAKFEIAGTSPEGLVDKEFIRKEIMGLNDEQIKQIDDRRLAEKKVDAKIEAAGGAEAGGAGGADDLFGGGEEETPLAGEEAGAAPPPEENASEEPEEKDAGISLLTGGDDVDEDETFALKLSDVGVDNPVKPQSQLQRYVYNNGRKRTHGASKTHMPDFNRMTKMTAKDGHSTEDPYDSAWFKSVVSDPLGEGVRHQWYAPKSALPPDIVSALRHMTEAWHRDAERRELEMGATNVLTEGRDVQDEIDGTNADYMNIELCEGVPETSDLLTEGLLDIDVDGNVDYDDEDDE